MPVRYDKDPYAILGLPPSATSAQVKQAFRRLARQYHPDLNSDPRAAERMKDINWAYSILGDAHERNRYDAWRGAASTSRPAPEPNRTYTYRPAPPPDPWQEVRKPQPARWSGLTILWLVFMLISMFTRSSRSSYASNPSSDESYQTLNAIVQQYNIPGTLTALADKTAAPTFTPSPLDLTRAPTLTFQAYTSTDIRSQVTPGSQVWTWMRTLLAPYPLTTDTGLSDDVISVRRDLLTGEILIETHSFGSFRIYYDRLGTPQAVRFP